jgi:hypothetical protein
MEDVLDIKPIALRIDVDSVRILKVGSVVDIA